jgi:ribosomal protein L21
MMAEPAALLAPEMRRRVLEIRQGEEISLSGPGAGAVVVRMLEKSGRKVRVLVYRTPRRQNRHVKIVDAVNFPCAGGN